MPTAPSIPDNCPHEPRPGLTVCLHCRHAAREAEAEKRRRSLSRVAVVGAVIGLGVMLATAALRARDGAAGPMMASTASAAGEQLGTTASAAPTLAAADAPAAREEPVSTPDSARRGDSVSTVPAVVPPAIAAAPLPALDTSVAPTPVPAADVASRAAPAPLAPLAPIVSEGRSELPDGLSVVRTGDSLTVHFDTELGRTRMPEKFERTVRTTLPLLYGASAEALLAGLPEGAIAGAGDLLTELPAHGVRIPTRDGRTLIVRPETRPGRDGPLVVRYIATVER